MTPEEITALFKKEVAKKDFTKRSKIDRKSVYVYRNNNVSLGKMLEVLLILDCISIVKK